MGSVPPGASTASPRFSLTSRIVGVDVHKYQHTAVALDCFGTRLDTITVSSDDRDSFLSWLASQGAPTDITVGLEDSAGHGKKLAHALMNAGYTVYTVPPILTDRMRAHSVHHDKHDAIDAERVGKVILTRREETLPATPILPKEQEEIAHLTFLVNERSHVVREQTGLKNQLHALLHEHYGNEYHHHAPDIFSSDAIARYQEELSSAPSALARSILRFFKRLVIIQEQIAEITKELEDCRRNMGAVDALATNVSGCGLVTACGVIAEVKTITRFATSAKLAKYAGIAPIARESGGKGRMKTNPFGNRKLNYIIHRIALSQIARKNDTPYKQYYQKKKEEGKSSLWSLRCMKRYVCNHIFTILYEWENTQKTASE